MTATAAGTSQIDLSWDQATDNVGVVQYKIYRDGSLAGTSTTTSFNDDGLAPATTYTYEVSAEDAAGNEGDLSAPASATTDEETTSGITLSASGYKVKGVHHVDLSWSSAGATEVDIYRDGAVIATTANDGTYTNNTGQRGGGSYQYTVCEAGTSNCSAVVTVTF